MFFILSKILGFIEAPLLWASVLMLWGLISKKTLLKKRLLITGFAVLFFFSNPFICAEVNRLWEVPETPDSKLKKYEAGILLIGNIAIDEQTNHAVFQYGTDRMIQAIHLYKIGVIKKIIISGGTGSLIRKIPVADVAKSYMLEMGIPDSDMVAESFSKNTRENALETKKILMRDSIKGNLLLITSGSHMRRALGCYKKVGISADNYSTDVVRNKRTFYPNKLLQPSADSLRKWQDLFHEWLGFLMYKIQGYI
ncbi:MAG: YdcF family protein [Bacteroidetes bacterium]|nr:YdcF family protein [Bacteroidota bacterium]